MTDYLILKNLGYILVAAAAAVLLLRLVRVPTIVAYMAAGLLLGPVTGLLTVSDSVHLLSEVGIALLLFLVGLELSLDHIRGVGRVAVIGGTVQIALTALTGWALAAIFGLPTAEAVVVALAVTFSSTVVVVKMLGQKGHLDALYGRIAVGMLLVQDVAVVMALTLFAGLGGVSAHGDDGETDDAAAAGADTLGGSAGQDLTEAGAATELARGDMGSADSAARVADSIATAADTVATAADAAATGASDLVIAVATAFGGMAGLAIAAALAARFVLPRVFGWVLSSPNTVFIWSLAWCFVFILAAELMHLSVELGAFIAGVSLAQLHYAEVLRRRVQPIVNFFLAVFFVSLGLQMRPAAALEHWPLVLAMCAAVLLIKPAIVLATVPRLGYAARPAFLASITLAQMSEFSFILAALAAGSGMLREEILSVITVAGFITIGISAYLISGNEKLYDAAERSGLLRLFRATGTPEEAGEDTELKDHIVIVGMNTLGRRLARLFTERGETVLVVDSDAGKLDDLEGDTLLGTVDDLSVLEEAGYERARLVISTLHIEDANSLLAYRCVQAGVPVSIHAFDTSLIDELRRIGVDHLIVSKHAGARLIARRLREEGVLD